MELYQKMRHMLLQNVSYYAKVYYKMICVKFFITKYELLQTATILLQIAADITKWDDFFS